MAKTIKVRLGGKDVRRADFFAVPCFERTRPETSNLPPRVARAARSAAVRKGFTGRSGQTSHARGAAPDAPTVVVFGVGKARLYNRASMHRYLSRAVGEAVRGGFKTPVLRLPDHGATSGAAPAESALRALALSRYRFDEFRKPKRGPAGFRTIRLAPAPEAEDLFRSVAARAQAAAEGIAITRDLANTPPNEAYPEAMAERAAEIAKRHGIQATIMGPREMERKGMGGILAVGRGSRKGPRMVVLEWGDGKERISLVGKGVTFDTGGISIKPSPAMDEMKFDKSGACTVMGAASAAASLDLPYRFRAYLPFAENMPDGDAYRPGDIVRCYNGKTVEILNTDAEGRMLLADALALAFEDGADCIVDYATLTGACVVALGHSGAGLFSFDDALAGELLEAAADAGENLWRLPLWREFRDEMKGIHADLRNSGSRWGGASTAAAFLSYFVGKRGWAHLDIAGPAYVSRGDGGKFGATGYGVALTIAWLHNRAL